MPALAMGFAAFQTAMGAVMIWAAVSGRTTVLVVVFAALCVSTAAVLAVLFARKRRSQP